MNQKKTAKKNQSKNYDPLRSTKPGLTGIPALTRQLDVADGRLSIVREIIMELEHKAKQLNLEIDGCNEEIARLEAKVAKKKK